MRRNKQAHPEPVTLAYIPTVWRSLLHRLSVVLESRTVRVSEGHTIPHTLLCQQQFVAFTRGSH